MMFHIADDVLKVTVAERPFGSLIKLRREDLGLCRLDVISLMGRRVTVTTLSNWETEFTLPALPKLRKLATALQLDADLLVRAWLLSRQNRDQAVAHAV